MSEIPLILGVGLGGIGLGTIIAAGYLYSKKDREQLADVAQEIYSNLPAIPFQNIPDEQLTPEQSREKQRIKSFRSATIQADMTRRQKIAEKQRLKELKTKQEEETPKIEQLEELYQNIQTLDEELKPLNDQINTLTPQQKRRQAEILVEARTLEKQIKKYPQHLRQIAKNNLSIQRDTIARETYTRPSELVTQETLSDGDYTDYNSGDYTDYNSDYNSDEDKTTEDDLNMPFEPEEPDDNLSSNHSGGSKYFTLTYTPKKLTKKYKSNSNKKKSKHNRNKKEIKKKIKKF